MSANLDMASLRTFTLIAQGRTFAEAGEAVGRSQSAVSLQIQRLEADLGASLFARARGGVELTTAGERLLAFAQRLVQMNDETLASMSQRAPRQLSFGVTPDFAETILPEVLDRFHQEYPRVEITLRVDGSKALVQAVLRTEIDLAVALTLDDATNQGFVADAPMIWIGRHGFLWKTGETLPLGLFEGPCIFRTAAIEALGTNMPFRFAALSPSLGGLLAAVRSGLCVTVRTPHLLQSGLVDVGSELGLPELPRVSFSYYARLGEKSGERDVLVDICKRYLSQPPAPLHLDGDGAQAIERKGELWSGIPLPRP